VIDPSEEALRDKVREDYEKTRDLATLHRRLDTLPLRYDVCAWDFVESKADVLRRRLPEALPYFHSIVVEPGGQGSYFYYDVRAMLGMSQAPSIGIQFRLEEALLWRARFPIKHAAREIMTALGQLLTKDIGL